ncbi:MAG: tRNA (adenosine(37)-N6)-dimethylallyltransferase MiaA [Muribaculaceae bacterium]|nr:tRNA (adenosine(37)-N6)-dimethylallyltransferase MiaA [Muribaculaceae bacterium]
MNARKPLLVVVTGPTASGKTTLAIELAENLGCDIVSADSRQIYRDIPIGTAAPTASEQARVRHHLVGFLPLDAPYSAAAFEADALRVVGDQLRQHGVAVMCGGSMMYVDAVVRGIDDMPAISPEVRERVLSFYRQQGLEALLAWLEIIDPDMHRIVDRRNPKRVIHAVEITLQAGVPVSSLRTGAPKERPFRVLKLCIDHPRAELFERINARVDAMMLAGMLDEALRVYPLRGLNSLNTVGYKELFAHFDGLMDLPTATARIAKNTRVYAKKQLTWLARDPDVHRLDAAYALEQALSLIKDYLQ